MTEAEIRKDEREKLIKKMCNPNNPFDWGLDEESLRGYFEEETSDNSKNDLHILIANLQSWRELQDAGLLWYINSILHVFGYSIMLIQEESGKVLLARPEQVLYRGFPTEVNEENYRKLTQYMSNNAYNLLQVFK
jgi:hypothetical protein